MRTVRNFTDDGELALLKKGTQVSSVFDVESFSRQLIRPAVMYHKNPGVWTRQLTTVFEHLGHFWKTEASLE